MDPKALRDGLRQAEYKRLAKRRERAAKASGATRDAEDTERAKKVERAGIPQAQWDAVLLVVERRLGPKWDATLGNSTSARSVRRKP